MVLGIAGLLLFNRSLDVPVQAGEQETYEWCHCPDGNPFNCQDLELPLEAIVSGHSNHEFDYEGVCEEPEFESELPYIESEVACGQATLSFYNPTRYLFDFDYRVDGEDGFDDEVSHLNIASGTYAGQPFGQRYNPVPVDGRENDHFEQVVLNFDEDSGVHTVAYRLWRGAENDWYIEWDEVEVESNCLPDEQPEPQPEPEVHENLAPACPDHIVPPIPLNVLVERNGDTATVKWIPTGGNLVNIYVLDGEGHEVGAIGDSPNDGVEEVHALNPTGDYTFELEQHIGCNGGERVRVGVVDSYLPMTFFASYAKLVR